MAVAASFYLALRSIRHFLSVSSPVQFMSNGPPFPHDQFLRVSAGLLRAVLAVSDAMVREAGLVRGVAAEHPTDRAVVIPGTEVFDHLKSAVTFRDERLKTCLPRPAQVHRT